MTLEAGCLCSLFSFYVEEEREMIVGNPSERDERVTKNNPHTSRFTPMKRMSICGVMAT